ncbi:MAG: LysM peptidoglycan-binding domain-containing protein [Bacteroidetes bacterium]|nr:LysM peptidoglycan-binding domain-containing protein [Bacteroidota bacterium]
MNHFIKIFLFLTIFLRPFVSLSQTKSNTLQKINGVDYYIHKIEKKQSLYSISKLYNVSVDEIYAINPDTKGGTKAGQEIKIPVKAATKAPITPVPSPTAVVKINSVVPSTNLPIDTTKYITYKVAKGETLYAISKRFNISEVQLKLWNPALITEALKDEQLIIIGEKNKGSFPGMTGVKNTVNADSINRKIIHRPKKMAYTIALILPFRLDQSLSMDLPALLKTNTNFPAVPALAIDFYLGFKKMADSLSDKDFEVSIDLYDVDDKDSLKLSHIINDPKFKQTDFIFGPLYPNGFKIISQKTIELGIPIVSPLTQQNKMLYNNVYASKTNPSQFTLLESLADYCIDSLLVSKTNIILVSPAGNDVRELSYVKSFKNYFNERIKISGKEIKDTIRIVKGISGVKGAYVPNVRNIIITLSNNQVFIADFTTQLAIFAEKKDIILCGWESVGKIDNIDQEYLNQLHFTFPSQYNIVNTAVYAGLIENYRAKLNAYPSENYFIGLDIGSYYLKNLKDKGPDFIFDLHNLPAETNYMRFKFTRPDNITGYDNRGVYIFRYNNFQLQKTGWK